MTLLAVLAVVAMMLTYLEGMIPSVLPIPGFKLGLANAVVTGTLLLFGFGNAAIVSVLRILLTGILFSTPSQLLFSMGGALLAFLSTAAAVRFGKDRLSFFGLSVLSAAAHNIGQMLVARIYFGDGTVLCYLPWLLLLSLVTGSITGALMQVLFPRLHAMIKHGFYHV